MVHTYISIISFCDDFFTEINKLNFIVLLFTELFITYTNYYPFRRLDTGKAQRAAAKFMKWLCYIMWPFQDRDVRKIRSLLLLLLLN